MARQPRPAPVTIAVIEFMVTSVQNNLAGFPPPWRFLFPSGLLDAPLKEIHDIDDLPRAARLGGRRFVDDLGFAFLDLPLDQSEQVFAVIVAIFLRTPWVDHRLHEALRHFDLFLTESDILR